MKTKKVEKVITTLKDWINPSCNKEGGGGGEVEPTPKGFSSITFEKIT